ncbi:hypothetical protein [Marinobacter salarius]|uniref:Uncharacterized protein n=1 Tax=Marinobacter salarius TaxID=1420917 RepID=A0A1W6K942_9GAMM|nr:hypothetical protein [Marinobacter salarius]ARM83933.1 hypothetical protein MARSALSMR5_01855 [Marinobacter salarius]
MNESNSNQGKTDAQSWEKARLWHELKESQAREGLLAHAGHELLYELDRELGGDMPKKVRRACDQLSDALPRDLRQQLEPGMPPYVEEKMGRLTKIIMAVGFPIMLGLLVWAYAVTLVD